jgi:mitochondrial intermembrane space import and assembly protein 40
VIITVLGNMRNRSKFVAFFVITRVVPASCPFSSQPNFPLMFRAARNIPLRRSLHTLPPSAAPRTRSGRLALAGAASVAAITYFAWKTQTNTILLDSKQHPGQSSNETFASMNIYIYIFLLIFLVLISSQVAPTARPKVQIEPPQVDKELEPKDQLSRPPEQADASPDGDGSDKEGPEAAGSAAFNPDTGEINWDCPCLGGMAHGPCGLQFREAFSCFVFSEQDPKGIDCVEKFKAMQDCFREHPEVYGEGTSCCTTRVSNTYSRTSMSPEIDDDDEDGEQSSASSDPSPTTLTKESTSSGSSDSHIESS